MDTVEDELDHLAFQEPIACLSLALSFGSDCHWRALHASQMFLERGEMDSASCRDNVYCQCIVGGSEVYGFQCPPLGPVSGCIIVPSVGACSRKLTHSG